MSSQKLVIIPEDSPGWFTPLPQCSLESGPKQNDLQNPQTQAERAFSSSCVQEGYPLPQAEPRIRERGREMKGGPLFSFSGEVGLSLPHPIMLLERGKDCFKQ